MQMKLLLLTLLIFFFCGVLPHHCYGKAPNPRAVGLEKRAALLIMANNAPQKLDSAIILLKEAIRIDPVYTMAYSLLARTYWIQKKPSKALTAMKRTTELEPENPEALVGYGMMLEMCHKTKEAYKYYQTAANLNRKKLKHLTGLDKQYLAVLVNYAYDLKMLNKQAELNRIIGAVLKDHPDYYPAKVVRNYSRAGLLKL